MNITVNGQSQQTGEATNLVELLDQLGVPLKGVAVERNLAIVPRSQLATTQLNEGDRIEIVSFVGGG